MHVESNAFITSARYFSNIHMAKQASMTRTCNNHRPQETQTSDQSKKESKHQESIQLSTTRDPEYKWKSDNVTLDITKESQEVSHFPTGDNKESTNRRA